MYFPRYDRSTIPIAPATSHSRHPSLCPHYSPRSSRLLLNTLQPPLPQEAAKCVRHIQKVSRLQRHFRPLSTRTSLSSFPSIYPHLPFLLPLSLPCVSLQIWALRRALPQNAVTLQNGPHKFCRDAGYSSDRILGRACLCLVPNRLNPLLVFCVAFKRLYDSPPPLPVFSRLLIRFRCFATKASRRS